MPEDGKYRISPTSGYIFSVINDTVMKVIQSQGGSESKVKSEQNIFKLSTKFFAYRTICNKLLNGIINELRPEK